MYKLPREGVDPPALGVLMTKLKGVLNNLVYWKGSLPIAGALKPGNLKGLFQLKSL